MGFNSGFKGLMEAKDKCSRASGNLKTYLISSHNAL